MAATATASPSGLALGPGTILPRDARPLLQGCCPGRRRHQPALRLPGGGLGPAPGAGSTAGGALRVLCWNVSGLTRSKTKEIELGLLLRSQDPDVAVLTEVELDKEDSSFSPPGYRVFYPLPYGNKIRLLLLLKTVLTTKGNPKVLKTSHQEIWLRLRCPSMGSWTFSACYRQWTGTAEREDLVSLCESITEYSSSSSRIVMAGDYNLDVARRGDLKYYRRLLLTMFLARVEDLGFMLENDPKQPTYRSHGCFRTEEGTRPRESVLDLVFSLGVRPLGPVRILNNAASDHSPLIVSYPVYKEKEGLKVIQCRNFRSMTPPALLMAINAENISAVFQEESPDKIAGILSREITAAMGLLAPERLVQVKDRRDRLLLQQDTRQAMAARDAAADKRDWGLYRRMRNLAARRVRRDRLLTNLNRLEKCRSDHKRMWQLADSFIGRGKSGALPPELMGANGPVRGDEALADTMNAYYVNKIQLIWDGLAASAQQQQEQDSFSSNDSSAPAFSFRTPTVAEVLKAIRSLKNTPAVGEDGIPTRVLKDLALVLAGPLVHLIGMCFDSGTVPTEYKVANIVPVHKKGKDPSLPASYRPVALLCSLSKILESVALSQFLTHLSTHLPTEQWGFRKARSTSGALAAAQASWTRSRMAGEVVAITAYDYTSAFDTLGVGELVDKLAELEVGPPAMRWFRHYLSGRRQRVRYGEACSSLRDVLYGVPQGSLIGPVLFSALVYDLPSYLRLGNNFDFGITMYADDVCVWSAHKKPQVVKERLDKLAASLSSYAKKNSLALNPGKTQLLWSGTTSPLPIVIGDATVQSQEELLLLGVLFDKKLSVSPHLQALAGSAKSLVALTRRLLFNLPRKEQVLNIVRSLVTGRLGYACVLFPPRLSDNDASCQLMRAVHTSINDIARLLLGSSRSDKIPVECLLTRSGLPSLNRLTIETIMCECWKALRSSDGDSGAPNPLGMSLCTPACQSSARSTRSASSGALQLPLRIKNDSFLWWAVHLYNDSPPSAGQHLMQKQEELQETGPVPR